MFKNLYEYLPTYYNIVLPLYSVLRLFVRTFYNKCIFNIVRACSY